MKPAILLEECQRFNGGKPVKGGSEIQITDHPSLSGFCLAYDIDGNGIGILAKSLIRTLVLIFMITFCGPAFADYKLVKSGGQIRIEYGAQFQLFFPGECYLDPKRLYQTPDGDWVLIWDIETAGCDAKSEITEYKGDK